jgi:hypothetical protein
MIKPLLQRMLPSFSKDAVINGVTQNIHKISALAPIFENVGIV